MVEKKTTVDWALVVPRHGVPEKALLRPLSVLSVWLYTGKQDGVLYMYRQYRAHALGASQTQGGIGSGWDELQSKPPLLHVMPPAGWTECFLWPGCSALM
jgi:hypothetical protein